jgi:NCS1 family nucleobase:cation symporter-1
LKPLTTGIVASIPFWDQGHPIPLGYFPKHYPQVGDLSFFVGFIVAAVVYVALNADPIRNRLRPA